jgi:sugar O-acyltransferase (sialic acid O-acetyltransferase NeuD family)
LHRIASVLDDDPAKWGKVLFGHRILGGRDLLGQLKDEGISRALVAIGDNDKRAELTGLLRDSGFLLTQAIHPTAPLLPGCRIGEGAVVLVNAFIGAEAVVGENAIISVGAVVGHDSRVGAFAQLCPHVTLAGQTEVGDYSFVGMGAAILPGVKVGSRVIIGANAVVNRDLPDGVAAIGVPSRIIACRSVET